MGRAFKFLLAFMAPAMLLMAMVPPLWCRYMNRQLAAWRQKKASQ